MVLMQAREAWSTSEEVHYRPGHFWLAQAPDVLEVRQIKQRCSIEGTLFTTGDFLVRIGRHFDRVASDPSGLTFEQWDPPDASTTFIVNATEIRGVNFTMTPMVEGVPLADIRRSGRLAQVVRSSPQQMKQYIMDPLIDDEIRGRCW